MRIAYTIASFTTLTLLGCASDDPGGEDPPDLECDEAGRYMPLATGNRWTYEITDRTTGAVTTKVQEVGPLETLDGDKAGIEAFRLTTQKPGGTVVSWQQDTGDAVLRHRELDMAGGSQSDEAYQPYKLRLDEIPEHLTPGATWNESYDEQITDPVTMEIVTTGKTESWSVEAVDEVVSTAAGDFCTVRLRKISTATIGGSDKTYWFARGVGKIREDGGDRVEELSAYQVQ